MVLKNPRPKTRIFHGAGDEARTRYLHLGKVALYRMSYTRKQRGYYSTKSGIVKPFLKFFAPRAARLPPLTREQLRGVEEIYDRYLR